MKGNKVTTIYKPLSPWGYAQQVRRVCDGIDIISTASHGGVRVCDDAKTILSSSCLERGVRLGKYLYFEEDCDAAIPLYELLSLGFHHAIDGNDERYRDNLYRSIMRWNPQYLQALEKEQGGLI